MSIHSQAVPAVFSFEAHEVRSLMVDNQPWFVAADVAAALEYRDAANMTRNLDDDERGTHILSTPSGDQEMLVINESGLYSAILKSRKPEAKRFKKWVTAEVLPTIRQTGSYTAPGYRPEQTRDVHALGLSREQQDTIKAHHKALVEVAPKEKQAKLAITLWSSIKSKFGVSYKDVPPSDFGNVISLMSRVAVEGEWLPAANVQSGYLLGEREAAALHNVLFCMDMMRDTLQQLESPLRQLGATLAGRVHDSWREVGLKLPDIHNVRQYADHAYLQQMRNIRNTY